MCGTNNDIQMHHLAPVSVNGMNEITIPLCFLCHRKVHGLNSTELNHSQLTRYGLQAAKARGQALGWSIPGRQGEQLEAARKGAAVRVVKADRHAETVRPLIEQLKGQGMPLRQIAAELNARNVKTARGGAWHAMTVRNVLQRAA